MLSLCQSNQAGSAVISTHSLNSKEVDGIVYEVDCAMITLGNENIDIGAYSLSLLLIAWLKRFRCQSLRRRARGGPRGRRRPGQQRGSLFPSLSHEFRQENLSHLPQGMCSDRQRLQFRYKLL